MPTPRRRRTDIGIRRKRGGWQVFVEIEGVFRSKQFPLETPLADLRAWRDRQLAARTDMDDLVRTILHDPTFLKKLEQFVRDTLKDATQSHEEIEAAYGARISEAFRARLWPTEPS